MNTSTNIGEFLKGRLSIFIDASNVFFISKKLHVQIDYAKVVQFFRTFDPQAKVYFFTAYQDGYEKQMEYLASLEAAGITVIKKPLKFISTPGKKKYPTPRKKKNNENNESKEEMVEEGFYKGNMDVELAMDAIRMMSQYDTFLLFSGDSDFFALLTYLKEHDKNVVVVSHPGFVAEELTSVGKFINIGEYLKRTPRKKKPRHQFTHKGDQKKLSKHHSPIIDS